MDANNNQKSSFHRILIEKEKSILSFVFLIFMLLPISNNYKTVLLDLAVSSVDKWVNTIRQFSSSTSSSLFDLVVESINRFYDFISDAINFYQSIVTFQLGVISETGFILSFIYILLPFLVFYSIYELVSFLSRKQSLGEFLSTRTLFFIVLVFPFPTNFTWFGALLLIVLLIYWLAKHMKLESEARPEASKIVVVSWKYVLFVILTSLYLLIAVFDTKYSFKVLDFIRVSSNVFIVFLMMVFVLIAILWMFSYSKVTGISVLELFRENIDENMNGKRVLVAIIGIIMLLPIFDQLILQEAVSPLTFIVCNLPWIVFLVLFDPFSFFDQILTITTEGFDRTINTSREIFKGLVPIRPSEPSIIGSLQPSIFISLIMFGLFMLLYFFVRIYHRRQDLSVSQGIIASIKGLWLGQIKYLILNVMVFILAIIAYVFKPSNFERIFGHPYEMNTKPVIPVLLLSLFLTLIAVILAAIVWGVLEVKKGRSWRIITSTILINSVAVIIAVMMVTPFVWMLKNSLQTNYQNTLDFQKQGIFPDPFTTQNYAQLFGLVPPPYETLEYRVVTWLFNSIVAAVSVTIFLVIFSSMAGYVLAKREFVGRRLLFTLTIAIQMVPSYVQVIPLYIELNRLNFVGSLLGVILPFLIQPFSIFLCAEFMRGIPDDYLDAARIDGYSEFEIFRKIVLPLSVPVLSVMFIINIIGNWNAFMWPLLLLDQSDLAVQLRTLPLGIYRINAELQEQVGVILALATVIVIPIFVILFLAQDYIKRGVSVEGLKG
ncbi:MAG: carbohydrate ABC transporter permease [Candidatus Hodarchaeales archaeon]